MLIRSTLFSRLSYMSRENTELSVDLADVQKQIATGKRLTRMSEEPWSISQIHQLREDNSVQSVFKRASDLSTTLLSQTENALTNSMNVVSRLREIAVTASNDTYSQEDLDGMIEEVDTLKERIFALANSDFDGRFLFAGAAYDTEPFDSTFAYVGSTNEVSIDVSKSSQVEVGFDGSDVFQGSVDIFTAIDNFVTALGVDDDAAIQTAMGDFDDAFNKMGDYLTRVGGEMNLATDMREVNESIELGLTERLSSIEDVDVAEAMTRFSMMQTQYQINLQLTAKTRGMSLFERM